MREKREKQEAVVVVRQLELEEAKAKNEKVLSPILKGFS